jgi:hypothetical protein
MESLRKKLVISTASWLGVDSEMEKTNKNYEGDIWSDGDQGSRGNPQSYPEEKAMRKPAWGKRGSCSELGQVSGGSLIPGLYVSG